MSEACEKITLNYPDLVHKCSIEDFRSGNQWWFGTTDLLKCIYEISEYYFDQFIHLNFEICTVKDALQDLRILKVPLN